MFGGSRLLAIYLSLALSIGLLCQEAAKAQDKPSNEPRPQVQSATDPANRPETKAQKQDPALAQKDQEARALRTKAIQVLLETAQGAKRWDNKEAGGSVEARAADLLWNDDPVGARELLIQAWETVGQIEDPQSQRSGYRNYSKRSAARREVLLVAKRRDEKLAGKWIEEMAREKESERRDDKRGVFDDRTERSAVLLEMALATVNENPKAAAGFAIESLNDGISFGLQNVLIALQAQSFDLAKQVFRAALSRLRAGGMTDPNELLILSSYLYNPGRITATNSGSDPSIITLATNRSAPMITPAAQYDPALSVEFLNLAADLLANAPLPSTTDNPQLTARAQISAIQSLLGRLQTVAPEKTALLATRLQTLQADAQFSPAASTLPEGEIATRAGEKRAEYTARRVDSLEELAEREPPGLRRQIAFAKAAAATEPQAYERGWQLAGKISDETLRVQITNWLAYRAALHFIDEGDLSRAYTVNRKNEDAAQRAVCLIAGAQKLSTGRDELRAREWLREASAQMRSASLDESWPKIALGIVATYGKFDPVAALSSLEDAVKVMNQFPAASVRSDGAPELDRFTGIVTSNLAYSTHGFSLDAAIAGFPGKDFESVFGVLSNVHSPEARGLAIVTLCQRFLKTSSGPETTREPAANTVSKAQEK